MKVSQRVPETVYLYITTTIPCPNKKVVQANLLTDLPLCHGEVPEIINPSKKHIP